MSSIYNIAIYPTNSIQLAQIEGGGVISATPSQLTIVRANTCSLLAEGMFDSEEQAFWSTNATLTGALIDQFGNVITTVQMSYVSGSNGNFVGYFGGSQFLPLLGQGYTVVLTGTSDWGNSFNFPIPAQVVTTTRSIGAGTPPPSSL
jgi:hypothetical protein